MRLYLIRHADPDYENNTITEQGHLEAKALATRMKAIGLDRIYTSPLGRAQDTAAYTVQATGIEPVILPWTSELSMDYITDLDGKQTAAWNIAGELVRGDGREPSHQNWSELQEFDGYPYRSRLNELAAASDAFLAELGYTRDGGVYEITRGNDEAVAVFCHAGFGVSWIAHLLAMPMTLAWCGLFWAPASVTTIVLEARSSSIAVPRALAIGDTSHLYAEGLPENWRGLPGNTH